MSEPPLRIPIRGERFSLSLGVRAHVHRRETPYQVIDIFDTWAFGRVLTLDGHVQLAELDEHAYHEALVQIPLLSLERSRRALIVGGGDGGVARELCKHPSMERIDMVEIDEGVIEACAEHLPTLSAGAFGDPRLHLHVQDAFEFVRRAGEPYDLIVADSTDVYEEEDGGLSERLFTEEFYAGLRRLLTAGGMVVTQADNPLFCPYSLEGIHHAFSAVFPQVGRYHALVPSFGGFSAFCWGSNGAEPAREFPSARAAKVPLRYLGPETWALGFVPLPFSSPSGPTARLRSAARGVPRGT